MSDFTITLKKVLTRTARFIGRTAATVAAYTKFKIKELSALSKRRDLIRELGIKVYELAGNGLMLPDEATELVGSVSALDAEVEALRADHAARKAEKAEQAAAEKAARAAAQAAAFEKNAAEQVAPSRVDEGATVPEINVPEFSVPDAEDDAQSELPTLNI